MNSSSQKKHRRTVEDWNLKWAQKPVSQMTYTQARNQLGTPWGRRVIWEGPTFLKLYPTQFSRGGLAPLENCVGYSLKNLRACLQGSKGAAHMFCLNRTVIVLKWFAWSLITVNCEQADFLLCHNAQAGTRDYQSSVFDAISTCTQYKKRYFFHKVRGCVCQKRLHMNWALVTVFEPVGCHLPKSMGLFLIFVFIYLFRSDTWSITQVLVKEHKDTKMLGQNQGRRAGSQEILDDWSWSLKFGFPFNWQFVG